MKINAIDINNNLKQYDVILTYHSDEFNKDYAVYTDNVHNYDNEFQIYISEYNKENLESTVKTISNNEEFKKIKTEINSILLTMKNETDKLENN